ncbi:MAG: hypothetical protein Q4C60_06325 [Eubacteriales bacterium]|nr:hypothetical protein [Eubacteriales bacterium]
MTSSKKTDSRNQSASADTPHTVQPHSTNTPHTAQPHSTNAPHEAEPRTARQDPHIDQPQDPHSPSSKTASAPWTARRIAALLCIVVLVAMYLITLFLAIFASPGAGGMFRASLLLTIALPVFCWIFIWGIGLLRGRQTIASANILNSNPEERRRMEEAIAREQERETTATQTATTQTESEKKTAE